MRLIIVTAAILSHMADGAHAANKPGSGMNLAKCQIAWFSASPSGAPISKDSSAPTSDFTVADTNHDGAIDSTEFIAGCTSGLIKLAR
jgi:hypothetical protein